MTRLLFIKGSPRGNASQSNKVAQAYLAARQRAVPGLIVDELDIWQEPLPEFDGDKAEAKMTVITGGELAGAGRTAWDEITEIAQRFTSADEYLFTVPMWNYSIPYRLKLYIDIINQPGLLFGFDPATGYSGLLRNKRATSVFTSGVYAQGAAPQYGQDFHSTYFNEWLRSIGIEDITSLRFQPTLLNADPAATLAAAMAEAEAAAARI